MSSLPSDKQALSIPTGEAAGSAALRLAPGDDGAPQANTIANSTAGGQDSPLTAAHYNQIAEANWRGRKVRRAAGVASFSGWTLLIFGALTVLTGIFSLPALLLGVGLCIVAYFELDGSKKLRRLDASAPRQLGFNQLALAGLLALYGAWGVYYALTAPNPYEAHLSSNGQVADMIGPIARLHTLIMVSFYLAVIGVGMIAPGLTALYYFTRKSHLINFVQRTPAWIVRLLRAVN